MRIERPTGWIDYALIAIALVVLWWIISEPIPEPLDLGYDPRPSRPPHVGR